ncbi:MAG: glycerophosphodiester phosphodiesterase [Anaerolineae bacterium]|nr:glycerophosphodiester phosphodiesterase [Anaerolineae bacterium]
MNERSLVVACRGDREYFPENTIPAFESAISKGADGIELDVHYTTDKELIVHHFFNLGHTDNGKGVVCEQTLAELKSLDSGSWFGKQYYGVKKPTLSEVLEHCQGRIRFEIDMKDSSLEFLQRVIREVDKFDLVNDVELTTAHYPLLVQARKINPQIRTGTFFYEPHEWMPVRIAQKHIIDWAELLKINVVHLNIVLMDSDFIDKLHRRGFIVYGSNLDTEEQIQKGLELGLDSFSTAKIELAIRLQNEYMARVS